ncbi:MAG: T9SS type A sorting domain-containing protein [Actinobacteria bacterium]|nr:T9SS type A sorting domain-containing protein [Actinomycetota bacterium]
MKKRNLFLRMAIIFAVVFISTANMAFAQRPGHQGKAQFGNQMFPNLTQEQRQTVQETIRDLREKGATREEIHAAVDQLFDGWGIEKPQMHQGFKGCRGAGHKPQLTDEQRETLHTTIKEMRDQDATRDEIHAKVAEIFQEWGIEMPENRDGHFGHKGFGMNLTDEQRETLHSTIKEMRDQGATRDEIHAKVAELFKEWSIEKPAKMMHGRKGHKKGAWAKRLGAKLTVEQRQTLRETVKNLKDQGAGRKEIREAVKALFDEWGIERPESDQETPGTENAETSKIQASNFPNPFNPDTKITFTLPADAYVTMSIYNTQGQFVKTLINQYQSQGTHSIVWDGRNAKGELVPSGMYFYRIIAGKDMLSKRMILMK